MRKLLVLLVVIVAIGGGYSAYWFKQADQFKGMLAQSISNINDKTKALNHGSPPIRYEAIVPSGFPFEMSLEIVKPVVDVPLSTILQQYNAQTGAAAFQQPAANAPKEWIEEISYGNSLKLTSNLMGDTFTFVADGNRTNVSTVDGKVHYTLVSNSGTPQVCHVAFARKSNIPWNMEPLFVDGPTFFDAFRSMDCGIRSLTVKDVNNGAVLFTMDGVSISASSTPEAAAYRRVAFAVDMKAAKATPAYDPIMADYMQLAQAFMQQPGDETPPMSAYGEQNLSFSFAFDGPTDKDSWADPDMHMSLDINTLDLKNAAMDMHTEAHINTAAPGAQRTASVVVHSHSTTTPLYDTLLANRLASTLTNMEALMRTMPAAQKITMPKGDPKTIAASIAPKFSSMNPMTLDIDISAKGPKGADFLKSGALTISSFDTVMTPYGWKLKGSAAGASGSAKLPTADISLTLLSFDGALDGLMDYGRKLETLFSTPGNPPFFTVQLGDGIRKFVHGIAENGNTPGAKDLMVHFLMKDTGEMTVSGKQLTEVLGMYITDIAPNLPQQAPAAGGDAVPAK